MADEQISRQEQRRTRKQRAEMVARFRKSGLSRTAFAQRNGIHVGTLDRWSREAKRAPEAASPMIFSELKVGPVASSVAAPWAMEVISANGITIRCRDVIPVRELSRLLRG